MIPPFDWSTFLSEPWSEYQIATSTLIILQGFLVSAACGWIGVFLIIRRMALIGDAISHSVLPGLVLAAVIFHTLTGPWVMLGAVLAGFVTTLMIEWIQNNSRIKPDAAIGIVFASLFALGVVLVAQMKGNVHLDADCILFGNIAEVAIHPQGIPPQIIQSAIVLVASILLTFLFFKELIVSSFDPILASSVGIPSRWVHYLQMAWLSVVVVSAFESVGSVIVVAMLIIPGATALLLTRRLRPALALSILHSLLSSVIGYHVALWLNTNVPSAMVSVGLLLFFFTWFLSPSQGIIPVWMARRDLHEASDG